MKNKCYNLDCFVNSVVSCCGTEKGVFSILPRYTVFSTETLEIKGLDTIKRRFCSSYSIIHL